jgi:hypothetical protein
VTAAGLFLLPGYKDKPGVLAVARHSGVERGILLSAQRVLAEHG